MKFFLNSRQLVRYALAIAAVAIAVVSLLFSNRLARELAGEERNKIEIWAAAMESLAREDENADMELVLRVLESNVTIPVILYDKMSGRIVTANNIPVAAMDSQAFLMKKMVEFAQKHQPIPLDQLNQSVYYDDSYTLKRLQIYPYIQLTVVSVFIALLLFALVSSQKAGQNRLWVGLLRETAHQLGTPISSLSAWMEYLKLKQMEPELTAEIEKDVSRLEIIAERFSKIGSVSDIKPVIWQDAVKRSVVYLEKRMSDKVRFVFEFPEPPIRVNLNESLFAWVVENLAKNAADAMSGCGTILFSMGEKGTSCFLDIRDTGKGIPKTKFKNIFSPGYTTKERGWGLGLSLVKRIVETYHGGKVFVRKSEIGRGTTFRIVLQKLLLTDATSLLV